MVGRLRRRPGDQNFQVGPCPNGAEVGPTIAHRTPLEHPPATATFCLSVVVLRLWHERSLHAAKCEPRILGVPYAIQVASEGKLGPVNTSEVQ